MPWDGSAFKPIPRQGEHDGKTWRLRCRSLHGCTDLVQWGVRPILGIRCHVNGAAAEGNALLGSSWGMSLCKGGRHPVHLPKCGGACF